MAPAALPDRVREHYAGTFASFGATPRGVDWPDALTQELRFVHLLRGCDLSRPVSLNDFGCGYGALASFLARRHPAAAIDYRGYDAIPEMIAHARQAHRAPGRRFDVATRCLAAADYTVASGVFNVKLDADRGDWEHYVEATLRMIAAASRQGFAVNFLGPPHPASPPVPGLYRTEPARWADFCAALGARVETFADYGLREFTLYVATGEVD